MRDDAVRFSNVSSSLPIYGDVMCVSLYAVLNHTKNKAPHVTKHM